jgi:hypothetical protein
MTIANLKARSVSRWTARTLALGAVLVLHGALASQASANPHVVSARQNGNNVTITYSVPQNTPQYTKVQTRWNGPGTNTTNEHQSLFNLGFGTRFTYTIPNVLYNQNYVFKVQAYSSTWSPWTEVRFTTKLGSYVGPLTLGR